MTTSEVLDALDAAIREAPLEERGGIVVQLATRLAQLGAGLAVPSANGKKDPNPEAEPELLTPPEAAGIFKVAPPWFNRGPQGQAFPRQEPPGHRRDHTSGLQSP